MREKRYTIQTVKCISLNIAVLADSHGLFHDSIINSLVNNGPDLIAIVGDLIDEKRPFNQEIEQFLLSCRNISPVYMSLGNNDVLTKEDKQIIASTGCILLDNQMISHNERIAVCGLTSVELIKNVKYGRKSKEIVISDVNLLESFSKRNEFKILLDHHPENYEIYTKNMDIDLVLSGHTHGGQISIAGYGLFVPGQRKLWPRYSGGLYDNKLVVSRGLSNTLPIPRIGNSTELVYVKIEHSLITNKY